MSSRGPGRSSVPDSSSRSRPPVLQPLGGVLRQGQGQSHFRPVVHGVHGAADGLHLQLHPLQQRIGTGAEGRGPPPHSRHARGGQRVPGAFAVGPGKPSGPQQDAAEIAGHHAQNVGDVLPLEHRQHRLTGGALRLAVVAVADHAAAQQIAPAVVPGVVVLLLHPAQQLLGLVLAVHRPHMAYEAGALFHKLAFRLLIGDIDFIPHGGPPTPVL